jgi:hypothetical protein
LSLSPAPRFFAKSAESLENKRVEFFGSAKKCKRVRKNVKKKNLNIVASDERPLAPALGELVPEWEFWAHTRQFA